MATYFGVPAFKVHSEELDNYRSIAERVYFVKCLCEPMRNSKIYKQ